MQRDVLPHVTCQEHTLVNQPGVDPVEAQARRRGGGARGAELTGVRALEALVELEGEGDVDLHHLHLRYAWRMRYHPATTSTAPAEHQVVAVDA